MDDDKPDEELTEEELEAREEHRIGTRIRVDGRTVEVYHKHVGPFEEGLAMGETRKLWGYSMSLGDMINNENPGLLACAVMFWLGRYKENEREKGGKHVSLKKVVKEFPTAEDADRRLEVEGIYEGDEPEVDDPEA